MSSFHKILDLSGVISEQLEGVVFIGGVAVYLHAVERSIEAVPPESSHDADFMISFHDYDILKDEREVTSNRRLAKHQMILEGVEFDVYVERSNGLAVPYDEVFAYSEVVEGVRVACLEHLLVLKLEALIKRDRSSKGEKDRRDVAKIGLLLGQRVRSDLVDPYLRPELTRKLDEVAKSSVFYELCGHNAHLAKKARADFARTVLSV
jgi:hypothetical protein